MMRRGRSAPGWVAAFAIGFLAAGGGTGCGWIAEKIFESASGTDDDDDDDGDEGEGDEGDEGKGKGKSSGPFGLGDLDKMMKAPKDVTVVDRKDLEKALPEELAGAKLDGTISSESVAMSGFKVATARARYADGDVRIDLTVADSGMLPALTGVFAMGAFIEKDSDDETVAKHDIDGMPVIVTWHPKRESGELLALYADRIMITLRAENIDDWKDAKKYLKAVDTGAIDDALDAAKKAGKKAGRAEKDDD